MLKIKRLFYFLVLLLFLCSSVVCASGWTEVRTLKGKITTLSQHFEKGKWTLVMLWSADCSVCVREYPAISDFHTRHRNIDAKVIGVSLDGYSELEKITRHIDEMPMSFNNLVGESLVVAFQYKTATAKSLQGTPTYLIFNPQGQLAGHHVGPVNPEVLEKFILLY